MKSMSPGPSWPGQISWSRSCRALDWISFHPDEINSHWKGKWFFAWNLVKFRWQQYEQTRFQNESPYLSYVKSHLKFPLKCHLAVTTASDPAPGTLTHSNTDRSSKAPWTFIMSCPSRLGSWNVLGGLISNWSSKRARRHLYQLINTWDHFR